MYEDFYGLSGKPFQLSPDPAFYFGSKGHTSAYSYLKYGVYQGEGFLVITGEVGAGKTTLVRALLEELDAKIDRRRADRQHAARRRRPAALGRQGLRHPRAAGRQGEPARRRSRRSC